ncbi:MAG TPA: glycosyltransferase [Nitrosomonas sp.]|nr:glycosyltransferase [Nitrosomonas sp.]HMW20327.1 glycosyltransferase [Nitrosomonas sp.]HMY89065.1 glycosyltransferase [Nitrosomonas sp.]HNA70146.1 glycosyltransferase [Nitrosomonas sp.]HNB02244.1 glycosyltransferase [Nitrosomonas sp.]
MIDMQNRVLELNPTISVIIPLYNHERYIDDAIDSLLQQTIPPFEIIIIDDGSHDNSWQRVQHRAKEEPRIITWSQKNQGAHYTLNNGLNHATGEYLAILNSDDVYHPQRLEFCLQAMQANPVPDVICTALAFINEKGKSCSNTWYEEALAFHRKVSDLSLALINGNFLMTTSNLFMHRSVWADLGTFANLRYAHDLDFFLRAILFNKRIVILENPLLHYRTHATNTINEGVLKVKLEWAAVVAYYAWKMKRNDWSYWEQLVEITNRHDLTRMLFFFFKYYQQNVTERLAVDDWLADNAFCKFLTDTIR